MLLGRQESSEFAELVGVLETWLGRHREKMDPQQRSRLHAPSLQINWRPSMQCVGTVTNDWACSSYERCSSNSARCLGLVPIHLPMTRPGLEASRWVIPERRASLGACLR